MAICVTVVAVLVLVAIIVIPILQQREAEARAAEIEAERQRRIKHYEKEWGSEICSTLIKRQISPGMTPKMVSLAWGDPANEDQKTVTKTGIQKFRWVYGRPRTANVRYVYFKNGEVDKIQT